jgi:hypothetical protein
VPLAAIIECVPERRSPGLAFLSDAGHDIIVKRKGRPDAHDASSLAKMDFATGRANYRLAMQNDPAEVV